MAITGEIQDVLVPFKILFEEYVRKVVNPGGICEFYWAEANSATKASYHVIVGGFSVSTKEKARHVARMFFESLSAADRQKFTIGGKPIIDFSVYSGGTQQFRLVLNTKFETPNPITKMRPCRPLRPEVPETERNFKNWLVQVLPDEAHAHPEVGGSPSKYISPRKVSRYRPVKI